MAKNNYIYRIWVQKITESQISLFSTDCQFWWIFTGLLLVHCFCGDDILNLSWTKTRNFCIGYKEFSISMMFRELKLNSTLSKEAWNFWPLACSVDPFKNITERNLGQFRKTFTPTQTLQKILFHLLFNIKFLSAMSSKPTVSCIP